jgi:hypothetical protein
MTSQRTTELRAVLQEWRGADAQLWQYSASLTELHIRLKRAGVTGNVHLVCNGCARIEAPSSWSSSAIEFAEEAGLEAAYVLKDVGAGFFVRCKMVRVMIDVEPIY